MNLLTIFKILLVGKFIFSHPQPTSCDSVVAVRVNIYSSQNTPPSDQTLGHVPHVYTQGALNFLHSLLLIYCCYYLHKQEMESARCWKVVQIIFYCIWHNQIDPVVTVSLEKTTIEQERINNCCYTGSISFRIQW